jgi:hypothetical protein
MAYTITLRYVPHALVEEYERNGWEMVNDLSWCHHGRHATVMRLRDPQCAGYHQDSEPASDQ